MNTTTATAAAAIGSFEEYVSYLAAPDEAECPACGTVEAVTGYDTTAVPDTHQIEKLACGHDIVFWGPGEPATVVATHRHASPTAPIVPDMCRCDVGEGAAHTPTRHCY